MKQIVFTLVLLALFSACGQNHKVRNASEVAVTPQEINAAPTKMDMSVQFQKEMAPPEQSTLLIKKKIIKNGRMGLRVVELFKTKTHIDSLVKRFSGYYANESFSNSDYESSYQLKIRVPSADFGKFTDAVENGEGEVLYKEIDAQDVTSEFIDLETRLSNKRNYLQRYNDLLKNAATIKDILDIEEKIRVLEEEIESTTGRLKYLNDQVDFSTLDLTISKVKAYKYKPGKQEMFWERLKQSLAKGWSGFVELILFLIKIWPLWLIGAAGFVFWKKRKKKRTAK